jgi:HTH-type transcriptional regulator/antitoxin HigA
VRPNKHTEGDGLETMSATLAIDRKKYVRLANRLVLKAIETEEEYDAMVATVGKLFDKGEENLSPEEAALLATMAILIHAYDKEHYPLAKRPPNEMVAYLMEASGRNPKDLLPILGTRGRVSEILSGNRSVSKEQAKRLGEFFRVSAELFI